MDSVFIIGGGIVGLASALTILKEQKNVEVHILEKESQIAKHQTGNNSGVIHSGIYYTPGSYKAKNCFEGYHKLLEYAKEKNIPYELCGKVIIAIEKEELPSLEKIYQNGLDNGLDGLKMITAEEVKEIEPYVNCIAGIKVPQAGIIDYKLVSKHLKEDIIQNGGHIHLNNEVKDIISENGQLTIKTNQKNYSANYVINCAGLYSDKVAKFFNPSLKYKIIPFRGEYYKLKKEKSYLVKGLIYPVPDLRFPFLGVHFTKKIDGSIEAGPNAVLAFRREGYTFWDFKLSELFESIAYPGLRKIIFKYWKQTLQEAKVSLSKTAYLNALKRLIPEVKKEDIVKGGAGVRAQLVDPDGNLINDFHIEKGANYINVINAPSPAATSCLAIGGRIANELKSLISVSIEN